MAKLVRRDTLEAPKMQGLRVAFQRASQAELDSKLALTFPAASHAYLFTTPSLLWWQTSPSHWDYISTRKGPQILMNVSQRASIEQLKNTNDLPGPGRKCHSGKTIFSTTWDVHLRVSLPGSTWKPKPFLFLG